MAIADDGGGKADSLARVGMLEAFEQDFWSGKSLTDLYSQASNQAETGPLERLFGY